MNETVGRIDGFLRAFAWFNHKANHGYNFSVFLFEDCNEDMSIDLYKRQNFSDHEKVVVSKKYIGVEWEPFLGELFDKWLFQFRIDPYQASLILEDRHGSFSLSHEQFRDMTVREIVGWFSELPDFSNVLKLTFKSQEFYELEYDDVLLVGGGFTLLLHLGQSD